MEFSKKLMYGLVFLLVVGAGVAALYTFKSTPVITQEYPDLFVFDYKRDSDDIRKLMKEDWWWLVEGDGFSVDNMLMKLSPRDENYAGQYKIIVARKDNQFVGFVAYYRKYFFEGFINFLAVRPEFRGQGYAQKLIDYAIERMKQEGVSEVTLGTRIENIRAQTVYLRKGFKETRRDNSFVYYAKPV